MYYFLFIFFFFFQGISCDKVCYVLQTTWVNELNSTMLITSCNPNTNIFSGLYHSWVGKVCDKYYYDVIGSYNEPNDETLNTTLGFNVNWSNKRCDLNSYTTWSGQIIEHKGIIMLHTTWLLTSNSDNEKDLWGTTSIGRDMFCRNSDAQVCLDMI